MTSVVREPAGRKPDRWRVVSRARPGILAWLLAVAGWSAYLFTRGPRPYLLDSRWYWALSTLFDPIWDFTDHADNLRGYSYPWLLGLVGDLAQPFTSDRDLVVRLLGLALVPALLCLLVPSVARRLAPDVAVTVPRLLVLNLLFFVSWRQDLLYPLSDIPALGAMVLGIWLTLRSGSLIAAGAAGLAWGFALNSRPAYLLAVVVAVATLALVERDLGRLARRSVAAVFGIALVLVPQVAINLHHFDSSSPLPIQASNLTRLQLLEGLRLARYETYRGDDPTAPLGLRFEHEGLTAATRDRREFASTSEYLGFVAQHPIDAGTVYGLHIVNGLDTRFAGTYIEELDRGVTLASVVNFTALVLGAATLLVRNRGATRRWRSPTTWFCLVLASACAPAIVGAMEPRFLMPLHLTLLAALTLGARASDVPTTSRGRLIASVAVVSAIVALELVATWSLTLLPPTVAV